MSALELRAIERIIATLTGALLIYLGYRLFVRLPERTDSDGKFILPGNISIYMSRVGPGAFFALFGTCVVIASFYFSIKIKEGSQNVRRPANYPKYEVKYAGETDLQKQYIEKNCAFGIPELSRFWNFGPTETELIYREGYVLQHSSLDKIPIWVCEGFTESQLSGPGDRDHSDFKSDPDLKGSKSTLSDYKNSGYDRGQMAPAEDFKLNQKLMDESHYLSNIAPQIGPKFNQGIWKDLEEEARSWLEDDALGYEKIYITTGGFFYDPQEEVAETADGWIEYRSIGSNDVSVPTHFFKIVTGRNSAGQWKTTAFVMENKAHGKSTTLKEKIVSVKWIEDRTGINFMPELDENEDLQTRLELVEGSMWSGDSN